MIIPVTVMFRPNFVDQNVALGLDVESVNDGARF